jgi:hypothetical protein
MRVLPSPSASKRFRLSLLPVFVFLIFISPGCGGGLNPVQGTVLYKNQPLKGALVTFHPKGVNEITAVRPVGLTDEDGTFRLTTGQKEGAPAGEYVVTVICSEEIAPRDKKVISTAPPETRDRFQGAYANAATSKLKAEIKNGANQLQPFDLK